MQAAMTRALGMSLSPLAELLLISLSRSASESFCDLNRTPIVCPVCQSIYQVTPPPPPPPSRRWGRAQPAEARKVEEQEADAPVLEGPEIVSLEEAEEGTSEVPAEEDEEIVDLGEEAAENPAGDDENAFLEEEEEGEADVSGIGAGDKNEEG